MNVRKERKSSNKGDVDSGLENASDSGNSCDEDTKAVSSDYENLLSSDEKNETILDEETFTSSNAAIPIENQKIPLTDLLNCNNDGHYERAIAKALNDNVSLLNNDCKEVIRFSKALILGQYKTIDFSTNLLSVKPNWLDVEKFKRGQKFARDHLFCINFAEMVSLFILFAQKSSLGPLIFTEKSDSPFKAFVRYLNTLKKLISWYTDDIWSDKESTGKKNINIVRGMHKTVYQGLTNCTENELLQKITLGDPSTTALWCPMRDFLINDFQESIPSPSSNYLNKIYRAVWLSQTDMSITQFGFIGLAVTYPKSFGIHQASDDDLNDFLHMWRGLGYLLGVKDEHNFCSGDLKTVRTRTKFFIEAVAKPAFRNVTCEWEHMCRCLTAGIAYYVPRVNFESSLLYLCHTLNINTPRLRHQMKFSHYLIFQLHRLVFYLMKYETVFRYLNSFLYGAIHRAQAVPQEVLRQWENREYSYMTQPGKCPIRSQAANHS